MKVLLALTFASLAFAACSGSAPDKVVGVLLKCNTQRSSSAAVVATEGAGCESGTRITNLRKELTIRTHGGTTYKVTVDANLPVAVGDRWPE